MPLLSLLCCALGPKNRRRPHAGYAPCMRELARLPACARSCRQACHNKYELSITLRTVRTSIRDPTQAHSVACASVACVRPLFTPPCIFSNVVHVREFAQGDRYTRRARSHARTHSRSNSGSMGYRCVSISLYAPARHASARSSSIMRIFGLCSRCASTPSPSHTDDDDDGKPQQPP